MSTFVKFLKGAASSNTVQINSILLAVWAAISNSEMVTSNPEALAIVGAVQAIVNIFLRFKTKVPISQRAKNN